MINAAAYTAVDKAESDEAMAHDWSTPTAPAAMARAAAAKGIPFLHVSTDYVFDGGGRHAPGSPMTTPAPLGCLWPVEAGRRTRHPRGGRHVCHPAHLVGLLRAWRELRQDDASPWQDARQPDGRVRPGGRADGSRATLRRRCSTWHGCWPGRRRTGHLSFCGRARRVLGGFRARDLPRRPRMGTQVDGHPDRGLSHTGAAPAEFAAGLHDDRSRVRHSPARLAQRA